jgi:hypothetical protein
MKIASKRALDHIDIAAGLRVHGATRDTIAQVVEIETMGTLRQAKSWEGGSDARSIVKPFVRTLRVTNPSRQSLASSRKRVLRPVRATGGAKRRHRVPKPRD